MTAAQPRSILLIGDDELIVRSRCAYLPLSEAISRIPVSKLESEAL